MKLSTKIFSLFLSFWMLMVSTGFSLSFHYCDGELESWSFLNTLETCDHHEEKQDDCCEKEIVVKSCCSSEETKTVVTDGCCDSAEKTALLETDFDFNQTNISIPVLISFASLFVLPQPQITNLAFEEYFKSSNEAPPLLIEDITIFIQSFLI